MFYAHMSAKNGVFAVCPVTYNHQKSLLTNYHTKSCIHLLSHFVKYGRIFIGQCRQYGDSSLVALFGNGKGGYYEHFRSIDANLGDICRLDLHR